MTIELLLERLKERFPTMYVREAFKIRTEILGNLMSVHGSARRLINIATDIDQTLTIELDIDSKELFILTNFKKKQEASQTIEYIWFTIELEMFVAANSPLLTFTK